MVSYFSSLMSCRIKEINRLPREKLTLGGIIESTENPHLLQCPIYGRLTGDLG
jgi:hypothetical protein